MRKCQIDHERLAQIAYISQGSYTTCWDCLKVITAQLPHTVGTWIDHPAGGGPPVYIRNTPLSGRPSSYYNYSNHLGKTPPWLGAHNGRELKSPKAVRKNRRRRLAKKLKRDAFYYLVMALPSWIITVTIFHLLGWEGGNVWPY